MKNVTLPVLITSIASKVDGSIKVTMETRELPSDIAVGLFDMRNKESWAILSPNPVTESEIPDEKADPMLGTKTQAQRLRSVLYRLWEKTSKDIDFESYYRTHMERIIDQIKDKLE